MKATCREEGLPIARLAYLNELYAAIDKYAYRRSSKKVWRPLSQGMCTSSYVKNVFQTFVGHFADIMIWIVAFVGRASAKQ
jgi:hypothetical protein